MTDQNISKPARRMARMPAENADSGPDQVLPQTEATAAPGARPESKIALVTRLLERNEGASLDELVTATGWLLHTTRAALTGLKKKGHVITKSKAVDVTRYTITKAAAA